MRHKCHLMHAIQQGIAHPYFTNRPMDGMIGPLVMTVKVEDGKQWWSACPNIDKVQRIYERT